MIEFTKTEARAIKSIVDRAIANDKPCIINAMDGVRATNPLIMAQGKIISAAAMKLGDEWEKRDPAQC